MPVARAMFKRRVRVVSAEAKSTFLRSEERVEAHCTAMKPTRNEARRGPA